MSQAQFTLPLIVQSAGNVIYASEWNAEFSNIASNLNPAGIGGLQDSLAQKQLQEDPATGLVASLQKEIEQLRFAVKRIAGETYWYTAPDTDLSLALFSGKAGDVALGDGTKTTTTPLLTLNADTGDAGVRLQVNNTSANAWDIYNDNSDSDKLKFDYNGSTKLLMDASNGNLEFTGSESGANNVDFYVSNASTGDAVIHLQVNGTSANEWTIYNDNSDNDALKMQYNGASLVELYQNSGDVVVTSGVAGETALVINSSGGASDDAGLYLRVNNTTANEWRIYNDNSDSDQLKFRAGTSQDRYKFKIGGTDIITFECQNITTATAPEANTLYPHSMIKAWGVVSAAGSLLDGFNCSVSKAGTGEYAITLLTGMASSNYAVVPSAYGSDESASYETYSTTTFNIFIMDIPTHALQDSLFSFMVIGRQ